MYTNYTIVSSTVWNNIAEDKIALGMDGWPAPKDEKSAAVLFDCKYSVSFFYANKFLLFFGIFCYLGLYFLLLWPWFTQNQVYKNENYGKLKGGFPLKASMQKVKLSNL